MKKVDSPACGQMRSIWFVFVCHDFYGGTSFLMYPCNADVHGALLDHYVSRCNTDVPVPRRLYLRDRSVRHSFLYLTSKLTVIYITVVSWTRKPPIEWVSLS